MKTIQHYIIVSEIKPNKSSQHNKQAEKAAQSLQQIWAEGMIFQHQSLQSKEA